MSPLLTRRNVVVRGALALFAFCGALVSACTRHPGAKPPNTQSEGIVTISEKPEAIAASIIASGQPRYFAEGRFYLVAYEAGDASMRSYEAQGVAARGLMPLYQRCTHLGCRVPFCTTSKYFECPCHVATFNGRGEYISGAATRGMDRFKITAFDDRVEIDPSAVINGPSRETKTVDQKPAGPLCVAP